MDYQVSARKYRPAIFRDVIGQSHIVQTLTNAITSKRIAHAFLFSGTRGVGKTTMARILAKALNCEQGPTATPCAVCQNCTEITEGTSVDVIEIDGASNTSVDDVREMRENVKFAPFRGSYRVYIIDEVHMLSNSAFNALLKTLEEPPAHVVFIFATTEIHKIPATILSRCQHYNFRRIAKSEMVARLRHVANQDGIAVEDRSLGSIARAAQGSMRDALSLLDQAVAYGGKTVRHTDLEVQLGAIPQEHVQTMIAAIVAQESPSAVRTIARLLDQGHDLRAYTAELVEYFRHLLVAAVVSAPQDLAELIDRAEEELHQIRENAKAFTPDQLQDLFRIFTQAEDDLRLSAHPRFVLEVAAVRATRLVRPAGARGASDHPGARTETTRPSTTAPITANRAPGNPPSVSPGPPQDRMKASGADLGGNRLRESQAREVPATAKPAVTGAPPAATPAPAVSPTSASKPLDPKPLPRPGSEAPPTLSLNWEQVVERIEALHPQLAPFLSIGMPVIQQGEVRLGYSAKASVARGMIEKPDNLRVVSGICEQLAGRPVRVILVELSDDHKSGPTMAEIRATKQREQKEVLLERTRSHPLVKQTLEVFGGQLVTVREVTPEKETK
jgi:DNA polymerase-3 subunit gamma/tau